MSDFQRVITIHTYVDQEADSSAWKLLQPPPPPRAPRRSRTFDDWTLGLFDHPENREAAEPPRRRASRHFAALGAPVIQGGRIIRTLTPGGLSLGAIRRMEAEEDAIYAQLEGMSIRNDRISNPAVSHSLTHGAHPLPHTPHTPLAQVPESPSPTPSPSSSARQATPSSTGATVSGTPDSSPSASTRSSSNSAPTRPSNTRAYSSPIGRPSPLRSQVLAARQARGRSRNEPIVISDSEDN